MAQSRSPGVVSGLLTSVLSSVSVQLSALVSGEGRADPEGG